MDYPDLPVVVITDGEGRYPPATAQERGRTAGIAIPDGAPGALAQVCRQVVELSDLDKLPMIIAALVPR